MHLTFFDLSMSFFLHQREKFFVSAKQSNKRKPTGANCSAWRRRLCAKDVGFSSARWRWFFCLGIRRLGFFIFVQRLFSIWLLCNILRRKNAPLWARLWGGILICFWGGWVATSPTQAGRCIRMGRSETLRPVGNQNCC